MKKDGKGGARTLMGLNFEDRVGLENVFARLPGNELLLAWLGLAFQFHLSDEAFLLIKSSPLAA